MRSLCRISSMKLSDEQVAELRQRWLTGGVRQYELAAEYGVSRSCICMILAAKKRQPGGGRKKQVSLESGQQFGRLSVIDPEVHVDGGRGGYRAAVCRCACGTVTQPIRIYLLINGDTRSCGCLLRESVRAPERVEKFRQYTKSAENRERLRVLNTKHGLSKHPLYSTWANMMGRCYQQSHASYSGYGARGIQVHKPWHAVPVFIAWVEENLGPRPAGCTIDREDNNGHYEPGNVRWADGSTQNGNKRRVDTLQAQITSLQQELEQLKGGDAE
jgi:hypothetical protein